MLRGCAVLFLKLQFLAFLAAGTAFASIPFGVLGFYGLIAIPDAWQSSSKGLRSWSTLGLIGALGWAGFSIYRVPIHLLEAASARGAKLLALGMGALLAVLVLSLLVVGGMGKRSHKEQLR